MAEVEITFTKVGGYWRTPEDMLYTSAQRAIDVLAKEKPNPKKIVLHLSDEQLPGAQLGLGFSCRNGVASAFEVSCEDGEPWLGPPLVEVCNAFLDPLGIGKCADLWAKYVIHEEA